MTYVFRDPGHLLWKLEQDMRRLGSGMLRLNENPMPRIAAAYDCATAAWHLCDWTAATLRRSAANVILGHHARHQIAVFESRSRPKAKDRLLSGIQRVALEREPEIKVCRLIATAAKHGAITEHDDESVDWKASCIVMPDNCDQIDDALYHLVIVRGNQQLPIFKVFSAAREFWIDFLDELGHIRKEHWLQHYAAPL